MSNVAGSRGEASREFASTRHEFTATTAVVVGTITGMADDIETLTRSYWTAVQRVRRMPVPMIDKLAVLADLEVLCRRERVRKLGALLAQLLTETDTACNTRQ